VGVPILHKQSETKRNGKAGMSAVYFFLSICITLMALVVVKALLII
jgi:hypothetical protein